MRYGVRYRARMRDTDVVIPRDCAASQTHQRNIGAPLQLADVFKPRTTLGSRWRFQHDPPGARPESPPPASSKVSGLAANADPKNSVTSRLLAAINSRWGQIRLTFRVSNWPQRDQAALQMQTAPEKPNGTRIAKSASLAVSNRSDQVRNDDAERRREPTRPTCSGAAKIQPSDEPGSARPGHRGFGKTVSLIARK